MANIVEPLGTTSLDGLVAAAKAAVAEQEPRKKSDKTLTAVAAAEPAQMSVEPPSRIATRMNLINRNDPNALERLVGSRDIVSINFFERGLEAAKSVCRIKVLARPATPSDYGTGFLITPGLLLTNNHVLPNAKTANRSLAEFGYELDRNFVERRGHIFPLHHRSHAADGARRNADHRFRCDRYDRDERKGCRGRACFPETATRRWDQASRRP